MKRLLQLIIISWGLTHSVALLALDPATSHPVEGRWITIDDKDGSKKSVVELSVNGQGELEGVIRTLLRESAKGSLCSKCPGELNNQPLEGLRFMWGLTQKTAGEWHEGEILDPKSGKVYKARLQLDDEGTLTVRGFIGFSLFGRSQTWEPYQP